MEIIIFPLSPLNCVLFVSILILLTLNRVLYIFLLSNCSGKRWLGFFTHPPPLLLALFALILYFHKRILHEQNSEDEKEMGKLNSQIKGKEGQSDSKLGT